MKDVFVVHSATGNLVVVEVDGEPVRIVTVDRDINVEPVLRSLGQPVVYDESIMHDDSRKA